MSFPITAARFWVIGLIASFVGIIIAAVAFGQMLLLIPSAVNNSPQPTRASFQFDRLPEFGRCVINLQTKKEEPEIFRDCSCEIFEICAGNQIQSSYLHKVFLAMERIAGGTLVIYLLFAGIFVTMVISTSVALAAPFERSLIGGVYIQAWCVEACPLFGITGTLVGMVMFFGGTDLSSAKFLSHFASAAAATMMGACTAVINQFLWVWSSWWR